MKKTVIDRKVKLSLINYCSFILSLLLSNTAFAQSNGKVQVIRDPLFDTLLAKRFLLNKGGGTTAGRGVYSSAYGYRVQIYNGSNRNSAYNAQARFNQEYPDMRTYISYREPNFKVRAGDFRSRLEAERMLQELKPWFTAMFIVPGKINPPKTVITND